MNSEEKHISNYLQQLLAKSRSQEQFMVPARYFDSLGAEVLSVVRAGEVAVNDDFFHKQQSQIISLAHIDSVARIKEEFAVPDGYMRASQEEIISAVRHEGKVVKASAFRWRRWYAVAAAAACVLFAIVMLWPPKDKITKRSFAELLEQTDLTEEDLEYYATNEDYDEWIEEEIQFLMDTTISDTTLVNTLSGNIKTEKEKKERENIKPNTKNKTLNWDSVTEEEWMEYLMEEADEDLLNEL